VFAVAPTGPALHELRQAVGEIERRGARIIAVSDDVELCARASLALPLVPGVPEWLSPLVAVVPGQLAAMRLARLRGVDLDNPLGLQKVTLTR
jgi:glucosamine--fructose-6-phosphate aminotransferase (isomerizing)